MRLHHGLLAAVTAGLLLAPSSATAGTVNTTMAAAPELPLGQLVTGGGTTADAWKVNLFAGDQVTLRGDFSSYGFQFELYPPGVDDYTVRTTDAAVWEKFSQGPTEVTFAAPFTGLGSVLICQYTGADCGYRLVQPQWAANSPTYSFTLTTTHKTGVVISGSLPGQVTPKKAISLSASVQSPAGAPTGVCNFERLIGRRKATLLGTVPVSGGQCAGTVNAGRRGTVKFRVSFVGDSGWQASSVTTDTIRAVKAKPKRKRGRGLK